MKPTTTNTWRPDIPVIIFWAAALSGCVAFWATVAHYVAAALA